MSDAVLYSPFAPRIHTLADEADRNTLQWAQTLGIVTSEQDAAKIRILKTGQLAARTHPDVSSSSLALIADWCTWFFEHDDICDEHLAHPQVIETFHRPLKAIIAGTQPPSDAIEAALLDLWQRTINHAPQAWTKRFTQHLNEFFDSKTWEAQQRYHQVPPALDTYIAQRPIASGMYVYIDLIEVSHQRWLDVALWKSLDNLRMLTARVCCWTNDILSFEREKAQGEVLNLVIEFMACDLDERTAKAHAIELHDSDMRAFSAGKEQLMQRSARRSKSAQQLQGEYIEHLATYMRGNLDWTATAARYLMLKQRERGA